MPRNKRDVADIWKKLAPKETLDRLIKEFNESKNVIGSRKCKNGGARYSKHLILDERKALQAFAVYIYIYAPSKRSPLRSERVEHFVEYNRCKLWDKLTSSTSTASLTLLSLSSSFAAAFK